MLLQFIDGKLNKNTNDIPKKTYEEQSETEIESETQIESKTQIESETKLQSKTQMQSKTQIESETQMQSETQLQSNTEIDTETSSIGSSTSINKEVLNKFAEYAEEVTEHHIARLNEGRNLGFWNTGVYVLACTPRDVMTVAGMLRSIYSGSKTYYEPIRLHQFLPNSNALHIVKNKYELLPLIDNVVLEFANENEDITKVQWHLLGKCYQYVSTPINTQELSLTTSLPRRDVAGLRFVKTAVHFANNPAIVTRNKITLGNIVDTGIAQDTTYDIDANSLVRHALITGKTGIGKSTTCKRILSEVIRKKVPVMVIEPVKDDYVRWAIEQNKQLPQDQQFKIYMPGVSEFETISLHQLEINPFEPAAFPNAKVDLLQHSEKFAILLNSVLPSDEMLPNLIEEMIYETIRTYAEQYNYHFEEALVEPLKRYPTIANLLDSTVEIMTKKSYVQSNKAYLSDILIRRFKGLTHGNLGNILNVKKSVDYHQLFSQNVIINLSQLANSKDKVLVMSLLMQALYEYRISCYMNDTTYRKRAQRNELLHLALIEEAHRILLKPSKNTRSNEAQCMTAELFGDMFTEIGGYGQGLMIADQFPSRLIEDVVKNTNYKIVHRLTSPEDQEMMALCMALRNEQKYILPTLEKGNAIIYGDEDDAAAWIKVLYQ